ncbi:MAG: SNF7 family protein [Candidatus Heimdallarchaeota archaeon]|nr:SNF7 family protein [Candidatus Heimdallarchaeota archaeon]MDH5644839.1 SNF7 family protein [Candidatus Heimdallarchaeota archaeon]
MRDLLGWLVSGNTKKSSRDHILNLKVVSRRLERSKRKLENQEKKTERNIRTAIQKGDMEAARLYAKDTVRSRKWARGYQSMISKIDGLVFKLERTEAVQDISKEMKNVAKVLIDAQQSLNLPELDTVIGNMQDAMENIEDASDIMEDSVDQLFESDTNETEVDSLLQEYGAEIGISVQSDLPTPSTKTSELEKQIESLRKEEE